MPQGIFGTVERYKIENLFHLSPFLMSLLIKKFWGQNIFDIRPYLSIITFKFLAAAGGALPTYNNIYATADGTEQTSINLRKLIARARI